MLGATMKASEVTETLDLARAKAGVDEVQVVHRPRLLSDNGYSPWELERASGRFVEHYKNRRYRESRDDVTPADAYHGRHNAILTRREKIKKTRTARRKRQNLRAA